MIIDVHTHLGNIDVFSKGFINGITEEFVESAPEAIKKLYQGGFITKIVESVLNDKDGKKFIKQMDEAKIDKSVLLMTDFGYEESMDLLEMFKKNLELKEKYQDRIILFWGIDCRRPASMVRHFENAILHNDVKGLKLYPPCGYDLDDPRLYPYYQICQKYKIPVLSHTGASNKDMYNDYDYIYQINEVSKKFPSLIYIMAHLTTEGLEKRIELCKKNPNIYCDISAFQKEIDTDTLEKKMKYIFETIPDQVLFGTDWPLYSMLGKQKRWVDYIQNCPVISDENKKKLFSKNFLKIINNEV